jgi:membrane-bound ClpP family serine protease
MWVVAGVLLGSVLLTGVLGFHSGPHVHAAAGVLGVLAAAWLLFMAADGRAAPLLWTLLAADMVVSAGVGALAWFGLSGRAGTGQRPATLEGTEGVVVTDLAPEGIVRVRGEQWSAVSVNGDAPVGSRVQVLRTVGVHLEVWAEEPAALHEPDGSGRPADAREEPR